MKIFRVLRAARDAFFFAYTARTTMRGTAFRFFMRYGAYGAICLPI